MTVNDFKAYAVENAVILEALRKLAAESDNVATREMAKNLADDFQPFTYEEFEKAVLWWSRSKIIDAESSTSHDEEYALLAERALMRESQTVKDFASRTYKPGEDPNDEEE